MHPRPSEKRGTEFWTSDPNVRRKAGTTTNTYGANTGQSITASQAPGGSTGKATYTNTAASTKYLASSATDDAGNTSFTYHTWGRLLTATDGRRTTTTYGYDADDRLVSNLATTTD